MNTEKKAKAEDKVIIETYTENRFDGTKWEIITAYEMNDDKSRGKKMWAKYFKDGDLVEWDRHETISWEEFCSRYKDCPKYASTTNS